MKKLLIGILLITVVSSCTFDYQAQLDVHCPCTVGGIEKLEDEYKIKVLSNNNRYHSFVFSTTSDTYVIGDTIK